MDDVFNMDELVQIIRPLVELRELAFYCKTPDLGALDSFLASRPLISRLRLTGATWMLRYNH
jgi:hypothetical protein